MNVHVDFAAPEDKTVITLSRDGSIFAVIDSREDVLELVRRYRWSLHAPNATKLYARAERSPVSGEKVRIYMHRLLAEAFIGPAPGAKYHVDHINGNSLDNRLCNLRWLTAFENRWKFARHKCDA